MKRSRNNQQQHVPTIEQQLQAGGVMELNQYTLTNEKLTVTKETRDGNQFEVDLSPPLFVDKRLQSIHTNEMDMVIKLKVNNQYNSEKIQIQTLTSLGGFLAKKGLPVPSSHVRDVQHFLIQQQETPLFPQYEQPDLSSIPSDVVLKNDNNMPMSHDDYSVELGEDDMSLTVYKAGDLATENLHFRS